MINDYTKIRRSCRLGMEISLMGKKNIFLFFINYFAFLIINILRFIEYFFRF